VPTIDNGDVTLEPELVLGFDTVRPGRSVVHQIIGRAEPDIVLRDAGTRAGTLRLFFVTEADASFAQDELGTPSVWTLDEPALIFSVTGDVSVSAVGPGYARWTVDAGFQEVPAL
jgi:hypothetical protein